MGERRSHPDPRKEAILQRIMSLRAAVARKEALAAADQAAVLKLRRRISRRTASLSAPDWRRQAERLLAEIKTLDGEIAAAHEEIGQWMDKVDDLDLAWLHRSQEG